MRVGGHFCGQDLKYTLHMHGSKKVAIYTVCSR